ncbi:MAG: hypothetical protein ACXVA9_07780 [Bdellovibrionales bacterium]
MNISYVSRDLIWTEPMKVWANHKIAMPLTQYLKTGHFDLSVHWDFARGADSEMQNKYEMWTVLQTYDGRGNQIVRCRGNDFCNLTSEVASRLRSQLRTTSFRRHFSFNPLRLMSRLIA